MRKTDVVSSRRFGAGSILREWLLVVVVSAGLVSAESTAEGSEPGTGSAALTAIEDVKPLFTLPSLDEPAHDLGRHRGRVVLVHFFATWCEPCRPEMARLEELQSRLDGRPFTIVAVSVAEADSAVRRFFATDPSPFSVLLDRDRSITKTWKIQTLPTSVVLDHDMKARFVAEGDVNWARADVMNVLAGLLGDVPGAPGADAKAKSL